MVNNDLSEMCFVLRREYHSHMLSGWHVMSNLTLPRADASIAEFPSSFSSIPDGLLVAGGYKKRRLWSTEILMSLADYKVLPVLKFDEKKLTFKFSPLVNYTKAIAKTRLISFAIKDDD